MWCDLTINIHLPHLSLHDLHKCKGVCFQPIQRTNSIHSKDLFMLLFYYHNFIFFLYVFSFLHRLQKQSYLSYEKKNIFYHGYYDFKKYKIMFCILKKCVASRKRYFFLMELKKIFFLKEPKKIYEMLCFMI
jgi:hypothetical protein